MAIETTRVAHFVCKTLNIGIGIWEKRGLIWNATLPLPSSPFQCWANTWNANLCSLCVRVWVKVRSREPGVVQSQNSKLIPSNNPFYAEAVNSLSFPPKTGGKASMGGELLEVRGNRFPASSWHTSSLIWSPSLRAGSKFHNVNPYLTSWIPRPPDSLSCRVIFKTRELTLVPNDIHENTLLPLPTHCTNILPMDIEVALIREISLGSYNRSHSSEVPCYSWVSPFTDKRFKFESFTTSICFEISTWWFFRELSSYSELRSGEGSYYSLDREGSAHCRIAQKEHLDFKWCYAKSRCSNKHFCVQW